MRGDIHESGMRFRTSIPETIEKGCRPKQLRSCWCNHHRGGQCKTWRCGDEILPAQMQGWGGQGALGAELLLLSIPTCPLGQAPAPLAAAMGQVTSGELLAESSFFSAVPGQRPQHSKSSLEQLDNSRVSLSGFLILSIGNFSRDITDEIE